jgi:cAMP-dependent protein kinase regulator
VKEYISKWGLEDELSLAVNKAIKKNSDDPYSVIVSHMRELAREEEEEDEDIIKEGDAPMVPIVGRGQRKNVMAASVEIPEGWEPPVYPKEPDDEKFLKDSMANNKLMKNLAPSDRHQLMLAFQKKDFESGTDIIKQGDKEAHDFYILNSGTADITVNGNSVMTASKGIAFGELALLHGAPRAATVTAEVPVTAWALDELSFKSILMGKSQTDKDKYMGFLEAVPLLKDLSKDDKLTLQAALKEKEYKEGQHVICEGDEGNNFFLIRQGEVKCTKIGKAEEVSARLKEGAYFGELALLNADKRKATVTATMPSTVLSLDRPTFERVLGPLKDLMSDAAKSLYK